MAILLPSSPSQHKKMTQGERRLAARLTTKLEDDYVCWYDVPIGSKQLQPDFIVLHPTRGILVLEVKDWKIDTIKSITKATAEILTDVGLKHVANPLEQARSYAMAITNLLEADPFLVQLEGKHKGNLLFPWGFGTVLTNITRKQFDGAGLDVVIPSDKVICSDEMQESVDAEGFQKRLWGMFNYNFGTHLSLSNVDRIKWHLYPELRVSQGSLFEVPAKQLPNTLIAETLPDIIKVMDFEQEKYARNLGTGHRLIHGVAGSGKTMILAFRCMQLAQAAHSKPVLVLCFNKTLAAKLTTMLRARGAGDNVHIRHFHGWCSDMCNLYQLDLQKADGEKTYEQQVAAVIRGAETGRVPREQYAGILIDEGHDFAPEWFKLIVQMLDPNTDSLLLVYDDVQSIYKQRKPESWASVGINVKGRSKIFKINYRNTAEALKLAFDFVSPYIDDSKATEDIPLVHPEAGLRHGGAPMMKRFASFHWEMKHVGTWLSAAHKRGVPPKRTAVLCRTKAQVNHIVKSLCDNGIAASISAAGEGDAVQVLTMHSSKGLEFDCVSIPDLGALPLPKVTEAEDARLLYVAMTRATNELLLTHHSDGIFTRDLAHRLATHD